MWRHGFFLFAEACSAGNVVPSVMSVATESTPPQIANGASGKKRQPFRPCAARGTLGYPFVWVKRVLNGYSSTRVSLWDSLMFGRVLEYTNGPTLSGTTTMDANAEGAGSAGSLRQLPTKAVAPAGPCTFEY